jgi:hypothetical protein
MFDPHSPLNMQAASFLIQAVRDLSRLFIRCCHAFDVHYCDRMVTVVAHFRLL